jgi:hypothetical protein
MQHEPGRGHPVGTSVDDRNVVTVDDEGAALDGDVVDRTLS